MAADPVVAGLLAWLGTYAVHSTLVLATTWILTRAVSNVRRIADAAPAVRECLWRVALLAPLLTATAQRVLDVDPPSVLWTLDTVVEQPSPEVAARKAASLAPAASWSTSRHLDGRVAGAALPARAPAPKPAVLPFVPMFVPISATFITLPTQLDAVPRRAGLLAGTQSAPSHPLDGPRDAQSSTLLPATPLDAPATLDTPPIAPGFAWGRIVLALWLAGIIAGVAVWAREWISLRRHLAGRVAIDRGPVARLFADLCERSFTRSVRLTSAPSLSTPISLGILRAEVVIPPRANAHLSPDELEALFAHELAHVRRGDPLWLVIYRAIQVVFFFQPLNRVARVRLQDEAELLADDWAATQLPSRVSLASCLTEIAGWIVDERRMLPAPAMAARGTRLSLRVRRLLDEQHHPERARRPNGLLLLAGLAVTGVALFAPGIAAERPKVAGEAFARESSRAEPSPRSVPEFAAPVSATPEDSAPASTSPGELATAPEAFDGEDRDPEPTAGEVPFDIGDEVGRELDSELEVTATPFDALGVAWTVAAPSAVVLAPSAELSVLALEVRTLSLEADRRCITPELREDIDALDRDLAALHAQAAELEQLLLDAIQAGMPIRLGP